MENWSLQSILLTIDDNFQILEQRELKSIIIISSGNCIRIYLIDLSIG